MMRAERGLERELVSFLEHHRIERTVPPEMRARVLAAARAVNASGGVAPAPVEARPAPAGASMSFGRGRAPLRIAVAASLVVVAAAVGAAAALQARRDQATPPSARPPVLAAAPGASAGRVGRVPSEEPIAATPVPSATLEKAPPRPRRLAGRVDPVAAELDLLQRAHAAYTRRDFSTALTLVSEHARRFPKGNLAEQREALRVRSLSGAGRGEDAHRAAAAFTHRFPRSVLLSRIEDGAESPVP
ncbi:MAG TPA: hypothetical protein VIU64_05435 [Polyangia bacterium]